MRNNMALSSLVNRNEANHPKIDKKMIKIAKIANFGQP